MFSIKLTRLNDFLLEEVPTGQFKKKFDSFYVSYSPLSVTNIAEIAMFYIKMTILNDFPLEEVPVSPIKSLQFLCYR